MTCAEEPGDSYCTREEFTDYCSAVTWRWDDGKRLPCPSRATRRLGGAVGYCDAHWGRVESAFREERARQEPPHPQDVTRRLDAERARRLRMAEDVLARAPRRRGQYVYFVQAGEEGPIKIGTSRNPRARFIELQVASPHSLLLRALEPGGVELEAVYHRRFAEHRLTGEWFEPAGPVLARIAELDAALSDDALHGIAAAAGR